MSNEDICYLSASAALTLFGKRKLTSARADDRR